MEIDKSRTRDAGSECKLYIFYHAHALLVGCVDMTLLSSSSLFKNESSLLCHGRPHHHRQQQQSLSSSLFQKTSQVLGRKVMEGNEPGEKKLTEPQHDDDDDEMK